MTNINKKFVKAVYPLTDQVFEPYDFAFSKPKKAFLQLDWDDLSGKQRKAIKNYERDCRKQSSGAKNCKAKRFSLSNRGDTVLDFMVVPMPKVSVLTDDGIVRYVGVLFIWRDHLLLSVQQVQVSAFAGVNLSDKECQLVQEFLNLTGQRIWRRGVTIDRRSNARINLMQATAWLSAPPADRLASAISALPLPLLFGALHAVLATLMPMLEEDCKPYYLPALRLNEDNDTVRGMQLEALRLSLGGLAFARDRSGGGPLLPELALQDRDGISTLEQVQGMPVLALVNRDPVQRDLTDAMQRAQCELIATGFVKHPLRTVPLLTGTALPADNVMLALDWQAFTAADPDDFAALRQAFGAMLHHPEAVADRLHHAVRRMALDGRPYAETYLQTAAAVFDGLLFGDTAQAGTLIRRVDEMVARHRDQQAAQQCRFDRALSCLPDLLADPDVVAEDVKALREQGGLGFRYETKGGGKYAAFELGEDFPALLRRLGLRADDSASFREFLRQHDRMREASRNVRGRDGTSCSHALIVLE